MTIRRTTVALAFVAMLSAASLIPLTLLVGTAQATPQPTEGLANPSLEGAATESNGFRVTGAAETAPVARTGLQSVNLARAGGSPDANGTLGRVLIYPVESLAFKHVREFAFHLNIPSTISPSNLSHGLILDVPTVGEVCLIRAPIVLAPTSGWTRIFANNTSTYGIAAASCTGPMTNATLSAIQTDPTYSAAIVKRAWVETQTSALFWPAGRPIYVDDASLLALQSPLVRIQNDADNLCDGASFHDITSALECAAAGATILLAPYNYRGNFTISKPVTLCATAPAGTACENGRTDVRIEGAGGATPILVRVQSSDVTVRGLTFTNANYTAVNTGGSPVEPALMTLAGDRINVSDNRFQAAASTPSPTQTRTRTIAIHILSGDEITVADNLIDNMPPSIGVNGVCNASPCRTEGIRVANTNGHITLHRNLIDLTGARQAAGISYARQNANITNNTVTLPAYTGTNVGIESTRMDSAARIEGNLIQSASGEVNRPAYGISGTFRDALLRENTLSNLGTGIRVTGVDSVNAIIDANTLTNADIGIQLTGDNANLTRNVMSGVTTAVRLQGSATALLTMHDNRFGGPSTTLQVTSSIGGAVINARENNWGHYSLSAIRASISDASSGSSIDVDCFIQSDGVTRNCPPTVDFSWTPTTPSWRHPVNFTTLATPGSNAITQWAWAFGDGGTASTANASNVYAAPGLRDVSITITDAQGYRVSATKTIEVLNRAPEFIPLGTPSGRENVTLRFTVNATDADNDALTYRAVALPVGAVFNATNRTFTWVPSFDDSGNHTATFGVNDSLVETIYGVPIVVGEANAPPYLQYIGTRNGFEAQPLDFLITASDVDIPDNASQELRIHAFPLPLGATFIDYRNGTALFRWTPTYQQAGVYNLTVEANDGTLEVREYVKLNITDVNRIPVLATIAQKTVAETGNLQFFVTASDPDGDVLSYGAAYLPPGATFNSSPTRRLFEWTPNYDQAGYHNATFTAYDGKSFGFLNVTILVTNTNRAPTINPGPTHTILANRTILFQIAGADPDGQSLTYGVVQMPPNSTFDNASRIMSWRTSASDVGVHDIMFWSDDGDLRGYGPRRVIVAENRPPAIVMSGPARVDMREVASFSAAGTVDPDGSSSLSYQWDFDDRDGFTPQATGVSTTWHFMEIGHHNVTVRVQDVDGYVSTKRLEVVVDDVADLGLELLQAADATSATAIRATFRLSDGTPVADTPVVITAYYQPTTASPRLFERTFTTLTDETGTAIFVVPREGRVANFPGRHVVEASAVAATSYLGDEEAASSMLEYGYLL